VVINDNTMSQMASGTRKSATTCPASAFLWEPEAAASD
jgi:hypothetical protein